MRPYIVEVAPPGLDHDAGFCVRAEPFDTQAFVTKSAIEALVGAVLPGLPGIDERRANLRFGSPPQNRMADELWPVVRGAAKTGALCGEFDRQVLGRLAVVDRVLNGWASDLWLPSRLASELS